MVVGKQETGPPRLGVFAALGMVLVAIVLYSVVAYKVTRQTHDIGVRMTLGAARRDVLGMVFRVGLRLIGIGVAIRLATTFGATRVLASEFFGVSTYDLFTMASVVAVAGIAGLAACYFPAGRATEVDPVVALRYE